MNTTEVIIFSMLSTLGGICLWFMLGFFGFLIEAKLKKWTELDKDVEEEMVACVILGLLTFAYAVVLLIINIVSNHFKKLYEAFKRSINKLLKKMNKEGK